MSRIITTFFINYNILSVWCFSLYWVWYFRFIEFDILLDFIYKSILVLDFFHYCTFCMHAHMLNAFMHTHTHVYAHTGICLYALACTCLYTFMLTHSCMLICTCRQAHLQTRIHVFAHLHAHMCTHTTCKLAHSLMHLHAHMPGHILVCVYTMLACTYLQRLHKKLSCVILWKIDWALLLCDPDMCTQ